MARGPAPQWKRRMEPILDDHLRMSITLAGGNHDGEGNYALVVYAGCESRDRAKEIKKALYRSARYVGVSVSTTIKPGKERGTFDVHYRAHDKAFARQYVLKTYSSDRSKWAYDPRAKNPPKEAA